jgi:hypothetical protein
MGLAENIVSIGTNGGTTEVRMRISTRNRVGTNNNHCVRSEDRTKTGRTKSHLGIGRHHQLPRKANPASIVLFANSPDIMPRNAHYARARGPPSIRLRRKCNKSRHDSKQKMLIGPRKMRYVRRPKHGLKKQMWQIRNACGRSPQTRWSRPRKM